ncbi:Cro/CI family transcriptional regulator [Enterovirga aerilata]|uniref:Molecular chaperone n=1 Tax=Enterovirga aerilata TaxID=2730920 RepID=A0A849ILH9_9HYPH|nr:Cro/CI family transcriptional regulator [Enterovirga sp. DB1703]NNM74813.1 molecular chaperone [Enterovirga sp. DB1703]
MRAEGIEQAIRAAGSIGALARALGISQPAVSNWRRIPADRVVKVEEVTGIPRAVLRPDLYPTEDLPLPSGRELDEVDLLRSQHYQLLAVLLGQAPTVQLLAALGAIEGDATPLGLAYRRLAEAAREADADAVSREYFDLFIGVGRSELLPYASYYLTGFLNERPLARVRTDLQALGIEAAEDLREPEDHVAILCDVMAGLAAGRFEGGAGAERRFFERHLKPFAERFFGDLETARSARFYRAVGALGRLFMEIEAEAFALEN